MMKKRDSNKLRRVAMLRIAAETRLTPEEAIKKVIAYFGPAGHKMELISQTETSVYFEGTGGSIAAEAVKENGKTSLEFVSREWDYQVREFIRTLR
jgi:hypothetical protein